MAVSVVPKAVIRMMGRRGLDRVQLADQFQAAQARQFQIGDDQIEGIFRGAGQAVVAASFDDHFMAFGRQHSLQGVGDAGVVLDQQNSGGGVHYAACGSTMPKVVP